MHIVLRLRRSSAATLTADPAAVVAKVCDAAIGLALNETQPALYVSTSTVHIRALCSTSRHHSPLANCPPSMELLHGVEQQEVRFSTSWGRHP
eukprot:661648-Amphidinium_carterae.2